MDTIVTWLQPSLLYHLIKRTFFETSKSTIRFYPVIQPLLFWQSLTLSWIIGIISAEFPLHAIVAALILIWIDSRYWKWNSLLIFFICFGLGFVIGTTSKPIRPQYTPIWLSNCLEQHKPIKVTGIVQHIQGVPDNRLQLILNNVHPVSSLDNPITYCETSPVITKSLPGKLLWTWDTPLPNTELPLPGQQITATLFIRPMLGFRNSNTYNIATYWHRQNIYFQAWSKNTTAQLSISGKPYKEAKLRNQLYQQIIHSLLVTPLQKQPTDFYLSPEKSFIPALLFGDRFFLSTKLNNLTRYTGIAHSLALSGQHLAVVTIAAIFLIMLLTKTIPSFFILIPRYKAIPIFSLPFALVYFWIGNAPPSLMRATIMLCLWTVYTLKNSSISFLDIAIVTLLSLILINPQHIYHVGIQLSFAAVLSISFITPILYRLWVTLRNIINKLPLGSLTTIVLFILKIFIFTLGTTLIVQVATLPLCLYLFGYTTSWFLINILWLPILGIFVLPLAFIGLFLCSIQLHTLGSIILRLSNSPCELLIHLLLTLDSKGYINPLWLPKPHWTMIFGCYLIFIGSCIRIGRTGLTSAAKRMLLAGAILLFIVSLVQYSIAYTSKKLRLRIIDVGQGQSILIEWGRNKKALIDGGGFYSNRFDVGRDLLRPILSDNQSLHLEFLALTHPHRDHLKGFLFLAKEFTIKQVFSAILPVIDTPIGNTSLLVRQFDTILKNKTIPRKIVARGDYIQLDDDLYFEVLSPPQKTIPRGNTGLILRLVYKGYGLAILPGDAEQKNLRELLKTNFNLQAEVLVLPHHGSETSLVPEFYRRIQPNVAVASTGSLNSHHFPSSNVHNALLTQNIPLRTTAQEGEITFEWDLTTLD